MIKKEEVRKILKRVIASSGLDEKLELIDTLQRIGVDYHYKEEIDELLHHVYHDTDADSNDLYTTSLRFYLLRKHGHSVSSGKINGNKLKRTNVLIFIRFYFLCSHIHD